MRHLLFVDSSGLAERYRQAARSGDNPYAAFIRYLKDARRILSRGRAGKLRRQSRYIAKGGIRK
jgi:hypothetical protein